jgi:hypothetical protein
MIDLFAKLLEGLRNDHQNLMNVVSIYGQQVERLCELSANIQRKLEDDGRQSAEV